MELSIECLPCLLAQAVRLTKTHIDSKDAQRQVLQRITMELAKLENNASAPYAAHKIQRVLKDVLQNPDPYREEKYYYNLEMLGLEHDFSEIISSAEDRLGTALKLAAAGNIIDFGPGYDLSREKVLAVIKQTLEKDFPPLVFDSLKSNLAASRRILYLGDNSGEIVFDKMFIRTIKEYHPHLEVKFAARGGAVLNDITEEDAYLVGMEAYADIINNGTDIPGTVLEYCSPEFRCIFNTSDIIIAKGQGNFESLHGCGRENLYYIFLCKCDLFARKCGAKQNDIILMAENSMSNEQVRNEYVLEALRDTAKKIADLRDFNIPVILKTIEEYKQAGVEDSFIEQQKAQLEKVYTRIAELEDKARNLFEHLK